MNRACYNVTGAKEKQAAPKAIFVFHAPVNEQMSCASRTKSATARICECKQQATGNKQRKASPALAGRRARQRGFASVSNKQQETSSAKQVLRQQDEERDSADLRVQVMV